MCACVHACVRTKVLDRLNLCVSMYMCMRESVSRSNVEPVCVCVCICGFWPELAEIVLPVRAVCRESGEAKY